MFSMLNFEMMRFRGKFVEESFFMELLELSLDGIKYEVELGGLMKFRVTILDSYSYEGLFINDVRIC